MSNVDDQSDLPQENSQGIVGGIVRSLLKNAKIINNVFRSTTLGSFPTRLPYRSVGQSADYVSRFLEFRGHLKTANEGVHKRNAYRSNFHRFINRAIVLTSEMTKSTVLGTILFATYETTLSRLNTTTSLSLPSTMVTSLQNLYNFESIKPLLFVSSAGLVSGAVHGTVLFSWEYLYYNIFSKFSQVYHIIPRPLPPQAVSLTGTMLSHSIVHATLFGTYQLCNEYLQSLIVHYCSNNNMIGDEHNNILNSNSKKSNSTSFPLNSDSNSNLDSEDIWIYKLLAIAVSGGIAGVAGELVGHYLEPLESYGLKQGLLTNIKKLPRPSIPLLSTYLLPSSVGFLAYEFAK